MYKSNDKRYTVPMKNAEASVRMEGCQVTPQMREQCQRVLRGEVTLLQKAKRKFRFFLRHAWYTLQGKGKPLY